MYLCYRYETDKKIDFLIYYEISSKSQNKYLILKKQNI